MDIPVYFKFNFKCFLLFLAFRHHTWIFLWNRWLMPTVNNNMLNLCSFFIQFENKTSPPNYWLKNDWNGDWNPDLRQEANQVVEAEVLYLDELNCDRGGEKLKTNHRTNTGCKKNSHLRQD